MNKKILITGATGFIGSNLSRRLVRLGFNVHVFQRNTSDLWRIKDIIDDINLHKVDINEKILIRKALKKIKPDYIFHLASIGLYDGIETDYRKIINTNIIGTAHLIEESNKIGYECFVNTGSSSEYGAKSKQMSEEDICKPESIYAISKLGSTLLATSSNLVKNKPLTTLRLFSPYGPYDNNSRLISYAICQSISGKVINLANKKSVRDYVYIDDVVEAFIACTRHIKAAKGTIINISSGKQTSVEAVVKILNKVSKKNNRVKWNSKTSRPYESPVWYGKSSKAHKLLKWQPKHTFEDGLSETFKWFSKNKPSYYFR